MIHAPTESPCYDSPSPMVPGDGFDGDMGCQPMLHGLAARATAEGQAGATGGPRSLDCATLRVAPLGMALVVMLVSLMGGCATDGDRPDEVWMEQGAGRGEVVHPRAITYSSAGDTFFVIDKLARIQQIDHSGRWVGEWQMPDWHKGKPVGLTVGPDGNVYIADTHYHRVMVYSPAGELVSEWGELGTGPGQFVFPTDVAFDDQGRVFVSEYGDNDRVQVFDGEGAFLFQFGRFGQGEGELSRPQSLLIDGDVIYITDSCNHRISVFRTDGTFVRNMGGIGSGPGEFRYPWGLDMDAAGNLIVAEFGNNRVQLINRETGEGLGTWGRGGRRRGELAYPWAVAVDRRGRVVAVDADNHRLQVFRFGSGG
jgi:DNA-binding beta-propeller fold protein YncE